MKKILLVCSAGMSTSMLVQKMKKGAEELRVEADIEALSITEAKDVIDQADIVLLGPQVSYQKDDIIKITKGAIPVEVINMRDYGTMNGKKVLEEAIKRMEEAD